MNTEDNISTAIGNYTSLFLNRDFAYLFGGGMFLCIIQYILGMNIFLNEKISPLLFGYLSVSYFIGLSLYQLSGYLKRFSEEYLIRYPTPYDSQLLFNQFIIVNYDKKILDLYERKHNLQIVLNIIGACSFFGGVLLLVNIIYKVITSTFTFTSGVNVIMIILLFYGVFFMFHLALILKKDIEHDGEVLVDKLILFKNQRN